MLGVLSHLERLEERATESDQQRKQSQVREAKLRELQQKIQSLQVRKERLQTELAEIDVKLPEFEYGKEKDLVDSLRNLRLLREVQNLYRLTGVCVQEKSEEKLVLQFDTNICHKDADEHYVELLAGGTPETYLLGHHTLPAFLPLTELRGKLQKDGITEFVKKIREFLLAYMTRKDQVRGVEKHLSERLLEDVEYTLPVDYISLSLRSADDAPLRIILCYSDLLLVQPDTVDIRLLDIPESLDILPDESLLRQWEDLLLNAPVVEALARITGVSMETVKSS